MDSKCAARSTPFEQVMPQRLLRCQMRSACWRSTFPDGRRDNTLLPRCLRSSLSSHTSCSWSPQTPSQRSTSMRACGRAQNGRGAFSSPYPDSLPPLCGSGRPEQVAKGSNQGVHTPFATRSLSLTADPPLYTRNPTYIPFQVLRRKRRERRSSAGGRGGASGGAGAAREQRGRRCGAGAEQHGGWTGRPG